MRAWLIIPVLVLLALPSCGGSDEEVAQLPCIVPEGEMAEILNRDHVSAVPQDHGRCIYASDGQALVSVSVRTREQFDAERDRFESSGVKLPELVTVEGSGTRRTSTPGTTASMLWPASGSSASRSWVQSLPLP